MESADSKEARWAEARGGVSRWDRYFLSCAASAATMSKDPSTKVGCVLARDRVQVGTGYNGFPRGIQDDHRLFDREVKLAMVVHAEMNAILQAGNRARGSTLYLWGFASAPCTRCTAHVIQAGVAEVVSYGPPIPDRWKKDLELADRMLAEAGVGLRVYTEGDM